MEFEKVDDHLLVMQHEMENEKQKVYPSPLHSHEEIVRDKTLFMETLRNFHLSLGTRFMVPVLGGKELDLHLLYSQVTQRGGLVKVIEEKKWKEIISSFNFPPTTTSASFVLKRYYLSLLHHYEQVYFFNSQGPIIDPSVLLASSLTKTSSNKFEENSVASDSTMQKPDTRKRVIPEQQNKGLYNFTITGSIDGKFEHGYMVTVKIGTETLRGVLYHVHQPSESPSSTISAPPAAEISNAPNSAVSQTKHKRRKTRRHRDPEHPKSNRSAYNFFFAEMHSKLRALYPDKEKELSKMIGESWNKLTEEERMVYRDFGREDKERYKQELQEYKEKLKQAKQKEATKLEPPCRTTSKE